MASHNLPSTTLKTVTPEMLAWLRDNDLVSYWKLNGFDFWHELGASLKRMLANRKIKEIDKLKAMIAIGQLVLKYEKTRSKQKRGTVNVNIINRDALTGPQNGPSAPRVG
jgi:hypothetical protein